MQILCHRCGVGIEPNDRNMCARCTNNTVDLTAGVMTTMVIETCRGCERYHVPPRSWKTLAWGSKDLLLFLLARNKTVKKLNIIDSNFLYSEEHSKKISVEILILENGIEQACTLEFHIRNKQCNDCMRAEAKQYWKALVQVRQRPHHRRTFLYLEQLIKSHKAHLKTSNIKERKDGIDFYFLNRTDANTLVDFISGFYGIRTINSQQLISEDIRNNTCNKKFTYSVELLPFCKDDLVHITDKTLGLGSFALVQKVGSSVLMCDPLTNKTAKITSKHYFGNEDNYRIVMRSGAFRKYRVVFTRPLGEGRIEATVTEDEAVFYEVETFLDLKEEEIVCGYSLVDANLSTEVNIGRDVLLARVFTDISEIMTVRPEYLLDDELSYFVKDIGKNKQMLEGLVLYKANDRTADEFANMHL